MRGVEAVGHDDQGEDPWEAPFGHRSALEEAPCRRSDLHRDDTCRHHTEVVLWVDRDGRDNLDSEGSLLGPGASVQRNHVPLAGD